MNHKDTTDIESEIMLVPPPQATHSYQPVPHRVLIENVQEKLYKQDFEIVKKRYQTNHNASQIFAVYDLLGSDKETHMNIGFRNSYDKSLAVGLVSGATVVVCSNLMFKGDIRLLRRHTKNVFKDLDAIVTDVVECTTEQYEKLNRDANQLKKRLLSKREMAELAGRMFIEEKLVNPTQMNVLAKEIRNSGNFQGETLWDFYNHSTEALKLSHPAQVMQNHIRVHDFVMEMA